MTPMHFIKENLHIYCGVPGLPCLSKSFDSYIDLNFWAFQRNLTDELSIQNGLFSGTRLMGNLHIHLMIYLLECIVSVGPALLFSKAKNAK